MKKKVKSWKLLLGLAVLVIGLLIFPKKIPHTDLPQICYQANCYNLEIANTLEARERGLMDREYLGENSGMIFVFEKDDIHKFWMKDTLIPLDMIRLSSGLQVVYIANAMPCKQAICPIYGPEIASRYVLEINGGYANKIGLKIGDQMVKKGSR